MTHTLIRITTVALALVALAAPTAVARPADVPVAHAHNSAGQAGFPQRPVLDRPSAPPSSQPAPAATSAPAAPPDHGIDGTPLVLGIVVGLSAIGVVAGVAGRMRRAGARATA